MLVLGLSCIDHTDGELEGWELRIVGEAVIYQWYFFSKAKFRCSMLNFTCAMLNSEDLQGSRCQSNTEFEKSQQSRCYLWLKGFWIVALSFATKDLVWSSCFIRWWPKQLPKQAFSIGKFSWYFPFPSLDPSCYCFSLSYGWVSLSRGWVFLSKA
jgi:hypothetical protein